MKTKRTLSAAIAAILILSLVGCSTSPIDILDLAIGAVEIALPLVGPAVGIDPTTLASVQAYLSATSAAISQASTILSGTGTDAQKAAAIAQAFAGIAAPIVPAKYGALVTAVADVAKYVAQFLANQGVAVSSATHQLTQADQVKVKTIKFRADTAKQKLGR